MNLLKKCLIAACCSSILFVCGCAKKGGDTFEISIDPNAADTTVIDKNAISEQISTEDYSDTDDYSEPYETEEETTETELISLDAQMLTPEMQREVNIFLSNFSEAGFESLDPEDVDYNELIMFAIRHNDKKQTDAVTIPQDGKERTISAEAVDKTLEECFGSLIAEIKSDSSFKPLEPGSYYGFDYDGSQYTFAPAGNEITKTFTTVNKMYYDKAKDAYLCKFQVNDYFNSDKPGEVSGDVYHPDFLEENMDKKSSKGQDYISVFQKGQAYVKKVTENGKTRYTLLSLKTE